MGQIFQKLKSSIFGPYICHFLVFENFDQNLAKFGQNLVKNLVKFGQNGHVKSIGHEYSQKPKFQFKILFCSKVMHMSGFQAIKANTMAALRPSLIQYPVSEAFYHAKTGVQNDFAINQTLCEILGGKADKTITQYNKIWFFQDISKSLI